MAEKISTLILKVDLGCHLCYKKIRKTLCKLQEKERIHSIYYDEKNQTITISGPFDPQRLVKKICCKACKVIKDIQIKDGKEKPKDAVPTKDKPKVDKPAAPVEAKKDNPKDAPKSAEPTKDKASGNVKAKDTKPAEAAEPKKDKANGKPKDAKPVEGDGQKKDKPKATEPVKTDPVASVKASQVGMVYQSAWQGGPVCYGRPGYDGYYGGYCNSGYANTGYGASYGWIPESQPVVYSRPIYDSQPVMGYNRSVYETQPLMVYSEPTYGVAGHQYNKFFSEEDPQDSCTIM